MTKIAIVTDSTAYIPKNILDKHLIRVAPQVLVWGDKTYRDGIDITPDEFYTRLKTSSVMPTTSQATIGSFKQIYDQLLEEGCEILTIVLSSKLSGTMDSALQARDMLPGTKIEIVDSRSTAMAMGFQVLTAARAADQGATLQECKELAEKAIEHTGVVFAVDTLEFLHRGGRIGGASRFLATALNIKPILELTDGKVEAIEQVRTRKKSLQRLIELLDKRINGQKPVRLATLHASAPEDAEKLMEQANQHFSPIESVFSEVSPVVGNHAGPGTVGLAYMAGM